MQLNLPFDESSPEASAQPANDDQPVGAAPPAQELSAPPESVPFVPALEAPLTPVDDLSGSARQAPAQNLQEVMDRIAPGSSKLNDEMRSAIRVVARGIGRKPQDIPTDASLLRPLVAATTPARVGITPKRWANIRSLLLKALQLADVTIMPGRDTGGPDAAWRSALEHIPSQGDRNALSRFASYCSAHWIPVDGVTEEVFEGFRQALVDISLMPHPMRIVRSTAKAWNRASETASGWPRLRLSRPIDARRYVLPAETFPASFHADREAYLAQRGNPDPFADDYARPLRPDTVLHRRKAINQLATALAETGFPATSITSVAVLTDPQNAKAALSWLRDRNGGAYTPDLASKAQLLHTVAVRWAKNAKHAEVLRGYAAGFRGHVKRRGMTPKNRERLRQFDLEANVLALVLLPLKILEQAKAEKHPTEDLARQVMFGLAVEVLLVAPMRIKNLAWLDVDKNLLEVRRGKKATRHIVIPDFDTKSGAPFEMELPQTSQKLLTSYLDRYRPLLAPQGSPYLFPGNGPGARNRSGFGRALSEFLLRQTGLKMHPHLFRHLAAKLHLRAHPQQIEMVRLILSHASSETTEKFYSDMKADHAFRSYDATIESLRTTVDGPVLPPTPLRRRKRRT